MLQVFELLRVVLVACISRPSGTVEQQDDKHRIDPIVRCDCRRTEGTGTWVVFVVDIPDVLQTNIAPNTPR